VIDFIGEWLQAIWMILCESGPYLLVGLLLAGFIKVLIPEEKVFKHLGKNDFRSVGIASMVGVPIPLCSCSVLPSAMQLKKSGASKGATSSFLISTPETGVDSIGVTWALMDPLMTVVRPLAALLTALFTGSFVNVLVRRGWDDQPDDQAAGDQAHGHDHDACGSTDPAQTGDHADDHTGHSHEPAPEASGPPVIRSFKQAFKYGFGPLLDDLTPWFIIGFIVSGLITVLFPDDLLTQIPEGWSWLTIVAMLLIGIPLYICATASTPVAAALIAKGLDPGAALVLLLAGPATNIATILVVRNFLGRRVLITYLTCIAAFSVALGFAINGIYSAFEIDVRATVSDTLAQPLGWTLLAGGSLLTLFLLISASRISFCAWFGRRLKTLFRPLGFDPTTPLGKTVLALVAAAMLFSTGLSSVMPGEVGWVMRFGRIQRTVDQPGLVMHLPFPLERIETVNIDQVREATFGFTREGPQPTDDFDRFADKKEGLAAQSEVLTGDESLLSLTYSMMYRVADPYRFRFGTADPDEVLRACSESSMRRMIGHRRADEILVADREEMQDEALAILRQELASVDSGIEASSVFLLNVHAPDQVHYAYRDVASALEYKERDILKGRSYEVTTLADARAEAISTEKRAESALVTSTNIAQGRAAAFRAVAEAFREYPNTLVRDLCEAFVLSIRDVKLVLVLSNGVDVILSRGSGNTGASDAPDTMRDFLPPKWDEER